MNKWIVAHRHPCARCGKPCDPRSKICKNCWSNRRVIPTTCDDCGKQLSKTGKFPRLCPACAMKRRWQRGDFTHLVKRGEQHYKWKGGRRQDADGYIRIMKPIHHRATKQGYVLEHILVWEEAHGKPLPDGWIIHHLNGIPDDNRPSNLVAMPSKKHYLLLAAKAKRIQELEALLNNQGHLI